MHYGVGVVPARPYKPRALFSYTRHREFPLNGILTGRSQTEASYIGAEPRLHDRSRYNFGARHRSEHCGLFGGQHGVVKAGAIRRPGTNRVAGHHHAHRSGLWQFRPEVQPMAPASDRIRRCHRASLLTALYDARLYAGIAAVLLLACWRVHRLRRERQADLHLKYEERPSSAIHGLNLLRR